MERFTTIITENYNLEQEMVELVSKFTNEKDSVSVECTTENIKVSFNPNFGNGLRRFNDVMSDISKLANEYPLIGTTRIDENIFSMTLIKKKN